MASNFKGVHVKAKNMFVVIWWSLDGLFGPFELPIFCNALDYNSYFIGLKK